MAWLVGHERTVLPNRGLGSSGQPIATLLFTGEPKRLGLRVGTDGAARRTRPIWHGGSDAVSSMLEGTRPGRATARLAVDRQFGRMGAKHSRWCRGPLLW